MLHENDRMKSENATLRRRLFEQEKQLHAQPTPKLPAGLEQYENYNREQLAQQVVQLRNELHHRESMNRIHQKLDTADQNSADQATVHAAARRHHDLICSIFAADRQADDTRSSESSDTSTTDTSATDAAAGDGIKTGWNLGDHGNADDEAQVARHNDAAAKRTSSSADHRKCNTGDSTSSGRLVAFGQRSSSRTNSVCTNSSTGAKAKISELEQKLDETQRQVESERESRQCEEQKAQDMRSHADELESRLERVIYERDNALQALENAGIERPASKGSPEQKGDRLQPRYPLATKTLRFPKSEKNESDSRLESKLYALQQAKEDVEEDRQQLIMQLVNVRAECDELREKMMHSSSGDSVKVQQELDRERAEKDMLCSQYQEEVARLEEELEKMTQQLIDAQSSVTMPGNQLHSSPNPNDGETSLAEEKSVNERKQENGKMEPYMYDSTSQAEEERRKRMDIATGHSKSQMQSQETDDNESFAALARTTRPEEPHEMMFPSSAEYSDELFDSLSHAVDNCERLQRELNNERDARQDAEARAERERTDRLSAESRAEQAEQALQSMPPWQEQADEVDTTERMEQLQSQLEEEQQLRIASERSTVELQEQLQKLNEAQALLQYERSLRSAAESRAKTAEQKLQSLQAEEHNRKEEWKRQGDQLKDQVQQEQQARLDTQQSIMHLQQQIQYLQKEWDSATSSVKYEFEVLREAWQSACIESEKLRNSHNEIEAKLQDARKQVEHEYTQKLYAQAQLEDIAWKPCKTCEKQAQTRAEVEEKLAASQAEASSLQSQLESCRSHIASLRKQMEEQKAQCNRDLERADARLHEANQMLADAERRAAEAEGRKERFQELAERQRQGREHARAEADKQEQALKEVKSKLDEETNEKSKAFEEVLQLKEQLIQAQEDLQSERHTLDAQKAATESVAWMWAQEKATTMRVFALLYAPISLCQEPPYVVLGREAIQKEVRKLCSGHSSSRMEELLRHAMHNGYGNELVSQVAHLRNNLRKQQEIAAKLEGQVDVVHDFEFKSAPGSENEQDEGDTVMDEEAAGGRAAGEDDFQTHTASTQTTTTVSVQCDPVETRSTRVQAGPTLLDARYLTESIHSLRQRIDAVDDRLKNENLVNEQNGCKSRNAASEEAVSLLASDFASLTNHLHGRSNALAAVVSHLQQLQHQAAAC